MQRRKFSREFKVGQFGSFVTQCGMAGLEPRHSTLWRRQEGASPLRVAENIRFR